MANIHDAAAYIISKFTSPLSTMQLQKLTYFSQGWVLALTGKHLFPEEFSTWKNGPVAYELHMKHKGKFQVDKWAAGDPTALTPEETHIVDQVVEIYGGLSGDEMSDLTHAPGTPWFETRQKSGKKDGEPGYERIPEQLIGDHFRSLQQ